MSNLSAIVYSNPGCQPCRLTKLRLKAAGALYSEQELNDATRAQFRETGHTQAPVVEIIHPIHGIIDTFSGLNPDKIKRYFPKG